MGTKDSGHWPKKRHLRIARPDSGTLKAEKKIPALFHHGTIGVKVHSTQVSTRLRLREPRHANLPQTLTFQAAPPNPEQDPHSAGPALTGVTLIQ